jgi:adenosylmethionine-8-amino-7-oxononanoate aminotransferase
VRADTSSTASTRAALQKADRLYLWHPWAPIGEEGREPLLIVRGDGCIVTDIDGREYIDAQAAALNASCGYNCREIVEAVTQQMVDLMTFDLCGFAHAPAIRLAARYASLLPASLCRTFFCCSGSEAIECAVKMARMYHLLRGSSGRRKIISVKGGYHGATLAALSASHVDFVQAGNDPLASGFLGVDVPCARVGGTPRAGAAEELQERIAVEGPETVAAFLVEPVLGVGGIIVPPDGYLQRVREICSQHGILLIFDEVMTGFGRTGRMFAFEHWGVVPDILATSKGVSSGYVPLSAVTTTEEVYRCFAGDVLLGGFRHGHTNSGHAAACAAGLAAIEVIERRGLVENARKVGAHLLASLQGLRAFSFVHDVRGLGLMVGVQLVDRSRATILARFAMERGLIVRPQADVVSLVPPLILSEELADRVSEILYLACVALNHHEQG